MDSSMVISADDFQLQRNSIGGGDSTLRGSERCAKCVCCTNNVYSSFCVCARERVPNVRTWR